MQISKADKEVAQAIVEYKGSVFRPGIGRIAADPIKLVHAEGFEPIQPQRRGIPYHYQRRLSEHFALLRREGAMVDVDPREAIDAVKNVVITDKKKHGEIRMNIDATPLKTFFRAKRL